MFGNNLKFSASLPFVSLDARSRPTLSLHSKSTPMAAKAIIDGAKSHRHLEFILTVPDMGPGANLSGPQFSLL
jgi:hypothetical protein